MYGGKRRYGRTNKSVEQPIVPVLSNNSEPTFICSHCKAIRNVSLGYADIIFNTINNISKPCYRVCYYCFDALTTWIKG